MPRNTKVLGIVSLLTDASSEAVYPILPLFLTSVLGAPVSAVGLIESVAEATGSIMRAFSGWLSDRMGQRKPLVVAGYTLSNLAKPLLAFTQTWPAVLLLRFTDRLGKGIRTAPRDALIADSGQERTRGRDFGFHRALDTVGAAIGPLTAWAVLTITPGAYRTVFIIAAIPGTLAILLVAFAVRESPAPKPAGAAGESTEIPARPANTSGAPEAHGDAAGAPGRRRRAVSFRNLGRPFAIFAALSAVFAVGNSSDAMLVLRARDVGAASALVPLMYFVFNVVAASLATPFGRLSDRVGRLRCIIAGFGGYAIVYLGFALVSHTVSVWFLFAAYGIPYALTEGLTRAYVVDLVPVEIRATAIGTYTFVLGLAALPASLMAGLLWDSVGHSVPFWVSAALMMTAAVGLALAPGLPRRPAVSSAA